MRILLLGAAIVVSGLATLASPGTAPAASAPEASLRPGAATTTHGSVMSDGRRWAAYETVDGATKVLDAERGTSFVVRPPEDCQELYGHGGVVAIGGGMLLWSCRPYGQVVAPRPLLLDLRSRTMIAPPGAAALAGADPFGLAFLGVGRNWIYALDTEYHYEVVRYLNWHTGETREEIAGARRVADLDAPGLSQPLCAPIRRPEPLRGEEDTSNDENLAFDPSFSLRGAIATWTDLRSRTPGFYVQRCGGHPTRFAGTHLATGSGWFAWRSAYQDPVSARRLHPRRTYRVTTGLVSAAFISTRLFVSREQRFGDTIPPHPRWTIRSAPLPSSTRRSG